MAVEQDPFFPYWRVDPNGTVSPVPTLRDQFAMAALTGLILWSARSEKNSHAIIDETHPDPTYATAAFAFADQMLAERLK
jgi:hypothetical protein